MAILFAAAAFCTVYFGLFDSLDRSAEDLLYHHADGTSEKIKIIKIDDKSINQLGDFEKWDRTVYARLVDTLCVSDEVKPSVIGFDIMFSSSGGEGDEAFAEACREHGNVVCAFSYVFERRTVTDGNGVLTVDNTYVSDIIKPYPELYSAAKHGFANALMDKDDSYVRSSFLKFCQEDGITEYSLNAAIYKAYAEQEGFEPKFPSGERFSFRYSGKPGEYENVSLCDVLDGTVPAEAFDDCIVLVGAYTAGMMDAYFVPVSRGEQMYGVEIHANAIQALWEEKYLYKIPTLISAAAVGLLAGILAFLCSRLTVIKTAAVCVGTSAVKLLEGYVAFNMGYSGDTVAFPIFSAVIMAYYISAHYYAAKNAKKKIEGAFKKYVAPEIVNNIAKSGTYELELGGETRDIAVLFVDIRGFTPLSEKLPPKQVVEILNEYLKLTTSCIFKYGGTLDKFIGDATMAVFNAPFDTEDYIFKAVNTAWDIVRGGRELDEKLSEKYGIHIGFGVGVNCGTAVVGNIGCDFRMDYTAIGDTVNTAARLESKAPGGTVYISQAVYENVKDRISAESIGEIPLKGKSQGVFVYSVTGISDINQKI
ncbi:MAG: CHASE2 domain-containing protein [Huintestinicola sp.]